MQLPARQIIASMSFPVFLVEDEPQLRMMIETAINEVCDAKVIGTAATETAAVSWLNDHQGGWRLAVLDLQLESGTGFGVLDQLRPKSAASQVIVLTNSATEENRARCLALGALAVYDKTTEFDRFLDHCLRHHQQVSASA